MVRIFVTIALLELFFYLLACACFAAAEVAVGSLSGPLNSLDAARASSDVATPEVVLVRGGAADEAGENLLAAPAAPSPSAALVVVVAGAREVLCAQLDGLNSHAEAKLSGEVSTH